jgi:hypothetical protein
MKTDQPITAATQDKLDRGPLVGQLATWVRAAPMKDGFVIGLTGPWGSGKTSVVNLLELELGDEVDVVRFEPWLFSSADQLVVRFFDEISRQLKARGLKKLGRKLARYGEAVSPAAQLVAGPVGQLLALPGRIVGDGQTSAATQRQELRTLLLRNQRRIVVFIDDIDRLRPEEALEVLRLIKLVGDLPGIVYLVPYDRVRVEEAAARAFMPSSSDEANARRRGRDYLEKIVQVTLAMPPPTRSTLWRITEAWINEAVKGREFVAWNESQWQPLAREVSRYMDTLRDAKRLANVVPASLDLCGDEVASMDVLALAALRVFDPDIHDALPEIATILTGGSSDIYDLARNRSEIETRDREIIDAVLENSTRKQITTELLRLLFPQAAQLLGGYSRGSTHDAQTRKRVSARPVLDRYIHLALGAGQAPAERVDQAIAGLADPNLLREALDSTLDAQLPDLLTRTRNRIGEQTEPNVVEASRVLLDVVPRMRDVARPWPVSSTSRDVLWVIEALVASEQDPDQRLAYAISIINAAPTLSMRADLLASFRVPEDESSIRSEIDLLTADDLAHYETALAQDALAASDEDWVSQDHPLWLLDIVGRRLGQAQGLTLLTRPALLTIALAQCTSHPTGGRFVRDLQPLVDIAGNDVLPLLEALANSARLSRDEQEDLRAALAHRVEHGPLKRPDE